MALAALGEDAQSTRGEKENQSMSGGSGGNFREKHVRLSVKCCRKAQLDGDQAASARRTDNMGMFGISGGSCFHELGGTGPSSGVQEHGRCSGLGCARPPIC